MKTIYEFDKYEIRDLIRERYYIRKDMSNNENIKFNLWDSYSDHYGYHEYQDKKCTIFLPYSITINPNNELNLPLEIYNNLKICDVSLEENLNNDYLEFTKRNITEIIYKFIIKQLKIEK